MLRFGALSTGVLLGIAAVLAHAPLAHADPTDPVYFEDSNLEDAVKDILQIDPGDDVTKGHVTPVYSLTLTDKDISDITGLEEFTNLKVLQLGGNQVSDISPLEDLQELRRINFVGNNITDISPLEDLPELTQVEINDNQVSDISALATLDAPISFQLSGNNISDISPLKDLTSLDTLLLARNSIADIAILSDLENLKSLDISSIEATDFTPLENLTKLTSLDIDSNDIDDLTPLTDLENLESLQARSNAITDLAPLSNLQNLQKLDLWNNNVSDLSPLAPIMSDLEGFDARVQKIYPAPVDVNEDQPNPVRDVQGNVVGLSSSVPDVSYDDTEATYTSSTPGLMELTWTWDSGASGDGLGGEFSGTVYQDFVHTVALPQPDVTQAQCVDGQLEPPHVAALEQVEGIAEYVFTINGTSVDTLDTVAPGDRVGILAVPDPTSAITFEETPGWAQTDDGLYSYSLTIDQAPDCDPTPEEAEDSSVSPDSQDDGTPTPQTKPTDADPHPTALPATGVSDQASLTALAVTLFAAGAITVMLARRTRG